MTKRKKIAVFRALQLGDMLCTIPAFRSIRTYYPDAYVTLLGLPWAKKFCQRFSMYIDDFIPFPGYPGLPEQPYDTNKIVEFIKRIQNENFDLLLQMQGDGSIINPLMQLLTPKKIGGFYREVDYCPNKKTFLLYPENLSEIERTLTLTEFLGIPSQGTGLEFPIFESEKYMLYQNVFFQKLQSKPYICIHPGARDPKRRWNPLYFAYVADKLTEEDFTIVFTGTEEEVSLIKEIKSLMSYDAINFAGQLPLGTTAELITHSRLLISNCTGIVHIADALHVPTITIYLSSDPKRWAPFNTTIHQQIYGTDTKTPLSVLEKAYRFLLREYVSTPSMKGQII